MPPARSRARGTRARLALLAVPLLACSRAERPRTVESARADAAPATAAREQPACGAAPGPGARVRAVVVSENARGMMTTVRWARSPDGCALLVVEDPVGVEADPIPDVVRYAASGAGGVHVLTIDSAWDAAPDARWTRLAVGRAHVARAGESDTLPASAWAELARATGRPERDVRAAAFAASGMTVAQAVARPMIWRLAPTPDSVPRALPLLGGWRVRWAPGDSALLVGSGPARTGDDEPPRAWLAVDAATGRALGAASTPPAVAPAAPWEEAPLLDLSTTVDLRAGREIALAAGGGRVVGEGGRVARVDAAGARLALGPGVPLATTADGRAVLALAPRAGAVPEGRLAWRVVLYVVE